jgi:hypothetical protein
MIEWGIVVFNFKTLQFIHVRGKDEIPHASCAPQTLDEGLGFV